jgi:hypothetical protein
MNSARMKRFACAAIVTIGPIALLQTQGRGGGEWTTSGYDAADRVAAGRRAIDEEGC